MAFLTEIPSVYFSKLAVKFSKPLPQNLLTRPKDLSALPMRWMLCMCQGF